MTDRETILPVWCSPVARLGSIAYGAVVAARNARFDRGIGVRSIDRPVISVGNIVVGGTGKSPMVRWIAQWGLERKSRPLIALRGYRSRDGESDEAAEHQSLMPGARIAVGANRFEMITEAIKRDPSIDMVILDDGFQHRKLARNLDLVLIDGSCSQLDGKLLPLGWLREMPQSLARAGGVIVTHASRVDRELEQRVHAMHGRAVLAWCDHVWDGMEIHGGASGRDETVVEPREWLAGRRVAVWAAIGSPGAFVAQLKSCGAEIVHIESLRDHAAYGRATVARLALAARAAGATAIVTTRKDWVKVAPDAAVVDMPIAIARLRLNFCAGEEVFREVLEKTVVGG